MNAGATTPRQLVFVFDGLRADDLTPSVAPTACSLRDAGASYARAVAPLPALTRVAAAGLSTGRLPRATGIVGNLVWLRRHGVVDTGSARALERICDGRPLFAVPTLAELLTVAGRRFVAVGTGSTGCAHLLNPTARTGTGGVIRAAAASPEPLAEPASLARALERLGSPPRDTLGRLAWAAQAVAQHVIPAMDPDVLVFWSGEPDDAQHAHGVATAPARTAIRAADDALAVVLDAAARDGRPLDVAIASDHGACPTAGGVDVTAAVAAAFDARAGDGVVVCPNSGAVLLYDRGGDRAAELVAWALRQPWSGPVFSAVEPLAPGALPLSLIGCDHPSAAPAALVTMRFAPGDGAVLAASEPDGAHDAAVHGSLHPSDLHTPLVLHGPSYRAATVLEEPADLIDLAPTILHLAGVEAEVPMDGRLLVEALAADAPRPAAGRVRRRRVAARGGSTLSRAEIGDRTYTLEGERT